MDRGKRTALLIVGALLTAAPVGIALAQQDSGETSDGFADLPKAERADRSEASLRSAERAPDTDGDPTTVEVVYPDGTRGTVGISTTRPEALEGITTDELADMIYGEDDQ
jgi:hypothetical protein